MAQQQQKRLLTDSKSKLARLDLMPILQKEGAWQVLPIETRQRLYSLLPEPVAGQPPQDPDRNPLDTHYAEFIEAELRRWQGDLSEGKETRKWRVEALAAGKDRLAGKFDAALDPRNEKRWQPVPVAEGQRSEPQQPLNSHVVGGDACSEEQLNTHPIDMKSGRPLL